MSNQTQNKAEQIKLEDFLVEENPLPRYDPEELLLELNMRGFVEIRESHRATKSRVAQSDSDSSG